MLSRHDCPPRPPDTKLFPRWDLTADAAGNRAGSNDVRLHRKRQAGHRGRVQSAAPFSEGLAAVSNAMSLTYRQTGGR